MKVAMYIARVRGRVIGGSLVGHQRFISASLVGPMGLGRSLVDHKSIISDSLLDHS